MVMLVVTKDAPKGESFSVSIKCTPQVIPESVNLMIGCGAKKISERQRLKTINTHWSR
jgi:hypothetical protein